MSKLLVLVLVVLCFALASATRLRQNDLGAAARAVLGDDARDFMKFMRVHQKVYSAEELPVRLSLFAESQRFVAEHNARFAAGLESYEVEMNRFADWTPAEWDAFLTASPDNAPALPSAPVSRQKRLPLSALPTFMDWRQQGLVSDVKDQKQCGSCWTFSATGSMESSWAFKHGAKAMVNLSEQVYVDCLDKDKGCGGGWPTWVFAYAIANGGAQDEASYPYLGTDGHACKDNSSESVAQFTGWVNITSGDEMELMSAAATTPGVSVCIDASQHGFSLYKSGVYRDATCKKLKNQLDHAVLVTGYGTDNSTGLDYYLVKNSWGPKWSDAPLSTPPHSAR